MNLFSEILSLFSEAPEELVVFMFTVVKNILLKSCKTELLVIRVEVTGTQQVIQWMKQSVKT